MKLARTILEIAAFPVVAIVLFGLALMAAVLHLVAMPGLYLWEKHREKAPLRVP